MGKGKERRFELDVVKFFAIIFMITIHVYEYHQTFISTIWTLPLILFAISVCFFLFRSVEDTGFGRLIGFFSTNLNKIFIIQWLLISVTVTLTALLELEFKLQPPMIVLLGLVYTAVALGIAKIIQSISRRRKIRKMKENGKEFH